MAKIDLSVSVPFPVLEDQFVFVTGSCNSLGSWDALKAHKLKKAKDELWVGYIYLTEPIRFIFFIGTYIKTEKDNNKVLTIFKWEKLSKPHFLTYSEVENHYEDRLLHYVFGEESEDIIDNYATNCYKIALKMPGDLCRKSKLEVENTFQMVTQLELIQQLNGRIQQIEQERNTLRDQNDALIRTNADLARANENLTRANENLSQYILRRDGNMQALNNQQPHNQHNFGNVAQFDVQAGMNNAQRNNVPDQPVQQHQFPLPQQNLHQQPPLQPQNRNNNQDLFQYFPPPHNQNFEANYSLIRQPSPFLPLMFRGIKEGKGISLGKTSYRDKLMSRLFTINTDFGENNSQVSLMLNGAYTLITDVSEEQEPILSTFVRGLIEFYDKEGGAAELCAVKGEPAATNSFGNVSTEAPLRVVLTEKISEIPKEVIPEFVEQLKSVQAKEGNEPIFECKISGTPKPDVKWYKEQKELGPEDGKIESLPGGTQRLHLQSVCPNDDGNYYECVAANSAGTARSGALLTVIPTFEENAPTFKRGLKDQNLPKGSPLVLDVEVDGKPTNVQWFKDGRPLGPGEDLGNGHYRLIVFELKDGDFGKYSVKFSNGNGSAESDVSVTELM